MSVEIWPHIAPEALKSAVETIQTHGILDLSASWEMVLIDTTSGLKKRELDWLLDELHDTFKNLKHGLEDCYALLAPVEPGSTLVLSTSRNESVKGTVTRVGTKIVKGTIHLKLRTLPTQTLTLNPEHPVNLAPLTSLYTLLTHSLDLLNLTLSYCYSADPTTPSATTSAAGDPPISSPQFIAVQLRLLAQSLCEASTILKGPPLTSADPSWTTRSLGPAHFIPPLAGVTNQQHQHHHHSHHTNTAPTPAPPQVSFHLGIQDGSLVLWLRSLEPAGAPVAFGTKLALAIGTARRLEHDEADRVFGFRCNGPHNDGTADAPVKGASATAQPLETDVYVREKVRVESADPSLLSLSAKLAALGHTLALARRNLAAVMGEDLED